MGMTATGNNPGKTMVLVEGALCVALSVVLSSYLKVFTMPQGGSITLEMAPLLYYAYKYGCRWGVTAGALSGILQMLLGGYVVHPLQAILDYPAAFACMGIAGLFGQDARGVILGTVLAAAGRLACHVLSGVKFFSSYAPKGQNVWIYSLVYNAAFMVPTIIITAAVALVLWKKLLKRL